MAMRFIAILFFSLLINFICVYFSKKSERGELKIPEWKRLYK